MFKKYCDKYVIIIQILSYIKDGRKIIIYEQKAKTNQHLLIISCFCRSEESGRLGWIRGAREVSQGWTRVPTGQVSAGGPGKRIQVGGIIQYPVSVPQHPAGHWHRAMLL